MLWRCRASLEQKAAFSGTVVWSALLVGSYYVHESPPAHWQLGQWIITQKKTAGLELAARSISLALPNLKLCFGICKSCLNKHAACSLLAPGMLLVKHAPLHQSFVFLLGVIQLDQVIQVLLTTGMFVGGLLGFILDNTIPGRIC